MKALRVLHLITTILLAGVIVFFGAAFGKLGIADTPWQAYAAASAAFLGLVGHTLVVRKLDNLQKEFLKTFVPSNIMDDYFRDLKEQIRKGRIAEERIQREGGETHHETFSAYKRSVYARMKRDEKLANSFGYWPDATMPRSDSGELDIAS